MSKIANATFTNGKILGAIDVFFENSEIISLSIS